MYKASFLFLAFAASTSAFALSIIGPFSGTYNEDFESFLDYNANGFNGYSSGSFFGGQAGFTSSSGQSLWVIDPANGASWGLGNNGTATVISGTQAGGMFNNGTMTMTITFNSPAIDFGGMFVTVDAQVGGGPLVLDFFDTSNNFIGSESILTTDNVYVWRGWTHAGGIGRVDISGNIAPVMEDLQLNAVPEPASMVALGAGVLALLRRRKTA